MDPVLEVRTDPLFDLEGATHTLMMFSGSGKYERDYEIDVIDSAVGVVRRGIPARLNVRAALSQRGAAAQRVDSVPVSQKGVGGQPLRCAAAADGLPAGRPAAV